MSLLSPPRRPLLMPAWSRNDLWRRAAAVPSLDLNFAATKNIGPLVTFTRASTATFIDSAGVLQTAATDEPRFDHNPATGESLGLLVEEARTNLLLRSEEFDSASWVKTLATVTADAAVAPSGLTVADKLIGNSTVDAHYAQQSISGATNGISYTSSVYAKAAEISRIEILHVVGAVFYAQGYDLSNGTLLTRVAGGTTAATGGFIQSVGNGWYRCGITQTSDGTSGTMRVTLRSANTVAFDATSQGVLLWGAQLEAGAFPTSYIPTTTAAATRSADVAAITGTNFSSWFKQSEGTLLTMHRNPVVDPSKFPCVAAMRANPNTGSADTIEMFAAGSLNGLVRSGNVTQAGGGAGGASSVFSVNQHVKGAIAYSANSFGFAANNSLVYDDTSGTVPAVQQMLIGQNDTTDLLNAPIARITYWPQRLSNSTLQVITR